MAVEQTDHGALSLEEGRDDTVAVGSPHVNMLRKVAQEVLTDFNQVKDYAQKLFCSIMLSDVKALCRAEAHFVKSAFSLRVSSEP